MDPLSVTASILTLVSAIGAVLKTLEDVRQRIVSSGEFLMLMNSVTDVQATLGIIQDCVDTLKDSKAPAAQQSYRDLPYAIDKVQTSVNRLTDFIWTKLLRKGAGVSRLPLSTSKRKRLLELRVSISEAHQHLQLILLSANLRQAPALFSVIEETAIVQNNHHTQTSATLEQIVTQLTDLKEGKSGGNSAKGSNISSVATIDCAVSPKEPSSINASPASHQIRITTSTPLKQCDVGCNCQCHTRSQYQTPRWLSAVVGTLFYSSTNTPTLDIRPCNRTKCVRSQPRSSSHLTYYFPIWMMRRVLVYSTWSNLDGVNSSWMVRMPTVISFEHPCWSLIQHGNTDEIMQFLHSREISPYDIDSNGCSMLHWALNLEKLDICSLLVMAGADWHFEDNTGSSPIDLAWTCVLSIKTTGAHRTALRGLIGSEDSVDLDLSPINRIVLDLSSADIQKQLDLKPSRVNECDWMGRSPLIWAASQGNHVTSQLLLSHDANVGLRDNLGRTALHYACHAGSSACVNLLLNVGADPQVSNIWGMTALHYACKAGSPECVNLLLKAGADPNFSDAYGCTALHRAIQSSSPQYGLEEIIAALKYYHANIDARDEYGDSPLHIAAYFGNRAGIRALCKFGARMNVVNYYENTPICQAIYNCNYKAIKLLCEFGASLCWTSSIGNYDSVFDVLARHGTVEAMKIFADFDFFPIDYNLDEMRFVFTVHRDDRHIHGRRFPMEEERAAFENLLAEKGNKVRHVLDTSTKLETTLPGRDTQAGNDEEEVDNFEDALENLDCLLENEV